MRTVIRILTAALSVLFVCCTDPSGPADTLGPDPSILTLTLEETGSPLSGMPARGTPRARDAASARAAEAETDSGSGYEVRAVWTQCNDVGFSRYELYRSLSGDIASDPNAADTLVVFEQVHLTSWTDTGVSEGVTYYYAVRTLDGSGLDSWSNEESVTVPPDEPPAPSVLSGAYTGDDETGRITLQWTECPDDDFHCYRLFRSLQPGIEADPGSADTLAVFEIPSDLGYDDEDVEGLTLYYYALETLDRAGQSSWSNEISVQTPELIPRLKVFFIDPSHNSYHSGDAILLRTPGGRHYVIDGGVRAGSWSCGVERILPILDSLGADSLDGMVATHAHADHIGGLIGILQNMPVGRVWDPGYEHTTQTYMDFLEAVYLNGSDYINPRRGDIFDWDDDLVVECLHPVDPLGSNINNTSIVLRVTYGEVSFLFTGDLETDGGENSILAALSQGLIDDISADVLKVGHHGSSTSTSAAWLAEVSPGFAAIEVGYGNPYGHPHDEVIERLEDHGAVIYRTDLHGTFIFSTDGTDIEVFLR